MRRALFTLLAAVILAFSQVQLAAAWNPFQSACSNGSASSSAVCTDQSKSGNPINGPNGVLVGVINLMAFLGGVAAIIMIVISGFRFITASGNGGNVAGARNTLLYSVVGLAVIALSRTIILYFLGAI